MTLLVSVRDPNWDIIEPESVSDELAGFESWRRTVYGSRAAQSLGLQLLSSLAKENVYAKGADLQRLQAEVETALANLELFAEESRDEMDNLRFHFVNIIKAVHKAIPIGGGVSIE